MKWHVLVLGPYDSCFVGPFPTEDAATKYAEGVPSNFDSYVYDEQSFMLDQLEHGDIPVVTAMEAGHLQ